MKRFHAVTPLSISKPVAITAGAVFIVFALGVVGSSMLPRGNAMYGQVERVSVTRAMSAAPQTALKIQPPLQQRMANVSGQSGVPSKQAGAEPLIARTGALSLYVKDVDKAIAAINAATRQRSGDVLSMDDTHAADATSHASATIELRVPDVHFADAMSAVSAAGTVRTRSITAEDLSTKIVDSSARLRNLRRTEGDILKIMDRSGSVGQVLEAENQLSQVREQIETTDAEVKAMLNRVRYATLTVNLEAEVASVPAAPAGLAQLETAWTGAIHSLASFTLGILAAIIWLAAFTPYFLLAVLCGWLLRRRFARTDRVV